jgi:small subunit ribosomal protein S2
MFGGLKGMIKLPDALVVVDPRHEEGAVDEARKLGIPVVALLNSDCDRRKISHPIPANDASQESIIFVLDEIAKVYTNNLPVQVVSPDAQPRE